MDNDNRVAALLYFKPGFTPQQIKHALTLIEGYLDHNATVDKTGMIVNEYDPDIGGPVWYIP